MPSVVYDAVFVPGGSESVAALTANGEAVYFISEAFKHAKPIAAADEGLELLEAAGVPEETPGILTGSGADVARAFIAAIAGHRVWDRTGLQAMPA
jgi:catalase